MNRIFLRLRNSLATRVIISTVLLSLGVIYLTGSALNSQLATGIKKVNLESSRIEARSTIFSAEYRFLLAEGEKDEAVFKVINDIISSATSLTTNENAREVVFIRSPGNTRIQNYEITSNQVDPKSIPESLSKLVRKNADLVSSNITIRYTGGLRIPGLAFGQKVQIPGAGQYEMYMLFSLANQNATLDLIQRLFGINRLSASSLNFFDCLAGGAPSCSTGARSCSDCN